MPMGRDILHFTEIEFGRLCSCSCQYQFHIKYFIVWTFLDIQGNSIPSSYKRIVWSSVVVISRHVCLNLLKKSNNTYIIEISNIDIKLIRFDRWCARWLAQFMYIGLYRIFSSQRVIHDIRKVWYENEKKKYISSFIKFLSHSRRNLSYRCASSQNSPEANWNEIFFLQFRFHLR